MKRLGTLWLILTSLSMAMGAAAAHADSLLMASAAGYRKPLLELINDFTKTTGIKAEASFGHLKQIETQARQNPDIALLIADEVFLTPLGLADKYVKLGDGKLTLIYSKSVRMSTFADLRNQDIQRIATPDQKRAMYGMAAMQCMDQMGLREPLTSKILESDTVPQVGSYVALGEVDAGFVNLTEALAQGDKIGGYLVAPSDCYKPIVISAAVMKGHEGDSPVQAWLDYISSDPARKILVSYGLD